MEGCEIGLGVVFTQFQSFIDPDALVSGVLNKCLVSLICH